MKIGYRVSVGALKTHLGSKYYKFRYDGNGNYFEDYFFRNQGNLITKWSNYFEIYDKHLKKFRNKENVTLMEFGIFQGGSLDMWENYFYNNLKIIGLDINPNCKKLEDANKQVIIGDQEDRTFLKKVMQETGEVDLVIEDGGHEMNQQINTYLEVFPFVKEDGIFLIEDLHTSYLDEYHGGYKRKGTFIEFSKDLLDDIVNNNLNESTNHSNLIKALNIYQSVMVFYKKNKSNNNLDDNSYSENIKPYLNDFKDSINILNLGLENDLLKDILNQLSNNVKISINGKNQKDYFAQENLNDIDDDYLSELNKNGEFDLILLNSNINQTKLFESTFFNLKNKGVFCIINPNDILEFSKDLIDSMYAFFSESDELKPDKYSKSVKSINVYNGLLIFEKDHVEKARSLVNGKKNIDINF